MELLHDIIDDERRKGHTKLADRLDTILEGNLTGIALKHATRKVNSFYYIILYK